MSIGRKEYVKVQVVGVRFANSYNGGERKFLVLNV